MVEMNGSLVTYDIDPRRHNVPSANAAGAARAWPRSVTEDLACRTFGPIYATYYGHSVDTKVIFVTCSIFTQIVCH